MVDLKKRTDTMDIAQRRGKHIIEDVVMNVAKAEERVREGVIY